jgi:predicted DNA-binding transcriptional regulator AlpA
MKQTTPKALLDFMTLEEFCDTFGVTARTAWRWQNRRTGPPRIMLGRKLYYRRSSVDSWLKQREKQASAA